MAKEELAKRNSKPKTSAKPSKTNSGRFSCKYALTEIMTCAECGAPYRRVTWPAKKKDGEKRVVWRCLSRLESGKAVCKESPTIPKEDLHAEIMRQINSIISNQAIAKADVSAKLTHILQSPNTGKIKEIDAALERIFQDKMNVLELADRDQKDISHFDKKLTELTGRERELRIQKEMLKQVLTGNCNHARITAINAAMLEGIDTGVYSDALIKRIVESISVLADRTIKIIYKNNI